MDSLQAQAGFGKIDPSMSASKHGDLPTVTDTITAAVALDDLEWSDYASDLKNRPKRSLEDLLYESFDSAILASGLRAPEDVERAITRLAELAGALFATPARFRTVMEVAMLPETEGATESEKQAYDNLIASHHPRLQSALQRKDRTAIHQLAAEFQQARPWMTAARRAAHAPSDPEPVRRVFPAFLRMFAAWFDRADWHGAWVPKAGAYWILNQLAFSPPVDVRRAIVRPILQGLTAVVKEVDARYAVGQTLRELEEEDGNEVE
jgi:hypothetical protein